MKTLSEVCKTIGVTRRALQGYDEIGLLNPSKKTDAAAIVRRMLLKAKLISAS